MIQKRVKNFNSHAYLLEIEELNKLIPMLNEKRALCQKIAKTDNINEVEEWLNSKTGFVNTRMSAEAMGVDKEYNRILEIENKINGRITYECVTDKGKLKQPIIDDIREHHTIYYTPDEWKLKEELQDIIKKFNSLPYEARQNFIVNTKKELHANPLYMRFV